MIVFVGILLMNFKIKIFGQQSVCGTSIPQPNITVVVGGGGGANTAFIQTGTPFGPSVGIPDGTTIYPNVAPYTSVINVNGRAINNICLSQRIPAGNSFNNSILTFTVTHCTLSCFSPQPTYSYEVWTDNNSWGFNSGTTTVPRITNNTNGVFSLRPNTQSGSIFIRTTRAADVIYNCDSRIDEIHINRPFDSKRIFGGNGGTFAHRWNQIVVNKSPNPGINTLAIGNYNGQFGNALNLSTGGAVDLYVTAPDYRSIGNTYVEWKFNNSLTPPASWNIWNPNAPYVNLVGTASIPSGLLITASAMGCPVNADSTIPDNNNLRFLFSGTSTPGQQLRTQLVSPGKGEIMTEEADIILIPNPTSKNTVVKLPDSKRNAMITVVDNKGKIVMKTIASSQNTVLNTGILASGTYSVIIRDKSSGTITKTLIVAK